MVKLVKRKKNTRQRAGTTHGYGSMKKHRGAGHRGGRGNAGSGKRGDAKKPSYWKNKRYYGKQGFTSKKQYSYKSINAGHLCSIIDSLVDNGKASLKSNTYTVDLSKLGFDKLLGSGIVDKKIEITVFLATPKAVEKVSAAGGSVTQLSATNTDTGAVEEASSDDAE